MFYLKKSLCELKWSTALLAWDILCYKWDLTFLSAWYFPFQYFLPHPEERETQRVCLKCIYPPLRPLAGLSNSHCWDPSFSTSAPSLRSLLAQRPPGNSELPLWTSQEWCWQPGGSLPPGQQCHTHTAICFVHPLDLTAVCYVWIIVLPTISPLPLLTSVSSYPALIP